MKNIVAVADALQNDAAVKAIPEVIVDWNINRYIDAVASNPITDVYDFDPEIFPIESIILPLRPTKGINKARVGSATISDDYLAENASTAYSRYYVADPDDVYNYWTSPDASDGSTGALSNCKPQVVYAEPVVTNKILITLENSWASPKTFSIQTTSIANPTSDAHWTEIANQTTLPTDWKGRGQIVLYWNGNSWLNSVRLDNDDLSPVTTTIHGVRIVVTALEGGYQTTADGSAVGSTYVKNDDGVYQTFATDGKDARFDLIEISARLEVNISPYVITVSDDFELGEPSDLYPIGTVTSNVGNMTLSNLYMVDGDWVPGLFNSENTDSPYHKYIDANAEMTVKYNYFDEDDQPLGTVQQAVMYVDSWESQSDDVVALSMTDYSKFFNDQNVPAAMWEGLTVPQIVWRVLDSIGFVNYVVNRDADRVTEHEIPVFYTDGESTVWETLDELAKASQTAIYFDAFGMLQVKTRDFALSSSDAPVWTFTSETDQTQLANIISLDQTNEFEPNHYKVVYQKTNWSDENRGMPTMQKVWEPEGTVVLRATPLVRTLDKTDDNLWIGADDVRVWPYKGMVNINSELIRYEGKQFVYFTGSNGNTRNVIYVKSADEHKSRNNDTPWEHRHKNHYTGALKITEREVWNSELLRHPVDAEGYSVRNIVNGTHNIDVNGLNHLKRQSKVVLNTPSKFDQYRDLLIATRGDTDDTPFYYYGTKFSFKPSGRDQFAGIVIHNSGTNEDGYYIELTVSKNLNAVKRKDRNELIVYSRVNGNDKKIGDEALAIGEDIEYEVDVEYAPDGADHKIRVWVNGKQVFSKTVTGGEKNAANGKFGIFARGKTTAEFEYLYAVKKPGKVLPDDFSFMDKVKRGYVGDLWFKEWVFETKDNKRRVKKKTGDPKHRVNERYMDDFGPYVHEVREFDVKFDPAPVLHSRLYITNDWSATALEYRANPFGAKFIIANTYRNNAVIHGEDTLSYAGSRSSINQIVTVFGRALVIDESEEEVAKNEDQIRRRGKIESELTSPWIQSKGMAKDIVNWLKDNFSEGNENVTIQVFGNPLVQVGDIVHVTFPRKHIDHDFFVVGANNEFDSGISTTLRLRRRS